MSKITNLPDAAQLTGDELIPLVQNSSTKKANIGDYISVLAQPYVDNAELASIAAAAATNFIAGGLAAAESETVDGNLFSYLDAENKLVLARRTAGGSVPIDLEYPAGKVRTDTGFLQDDLDAIANSMVEYAANLKLINDASPSRFMQLVKANLYRLNDQGWGFGNLGDSMSHGAYQGNLYTNGIGWNIARAVCAEFGARSIGWQPMEGLQNVGYFDSPQPHTLTFEGDWGPRHPEWTAPHDYPVGVTGPGAQHTLNGKYYDSTDAGAELILETYPFTERADFMVKRQPGGGTLNFLVNDVVVKTVDTSKDENGDPAVLEKWNSVVPITMSDDGQGRTKITIQKSDALSAPINTMVGYNDSNVNVLDLAQRMKFCNFSQIGRAFIDVSRDAIILFTKSAVAMLSLGFNDVYGYDTDNDDLDFAEFQQRADWFIEFALLHETPVIIQDFILYKTLEQSRTRRELLRIATETNGIYIPLADEFTPGGRLPTAVELNDPRYLYADGGHPGERGGDMILTKLLTKAGFAVTSRQILLKYHDWAFPLPLNEAFRNPSPANIRSISTIRQCGDGYDIYFNGDAYDGGVATPLPAGIFKDGIDILPTCFRNGAALGLPEEVRIFAYNSITDTVMGTAWIANNDIAIRSEIDGVISRVTFSHRAGSIF
jgi:hypothetical protein|tara:strand:- start:9023 stop:11002 length:1980 start_codon:yes stop_codon:yes gene_type:complete